MDENVNKAPKPEGVESTLKNECGASENTQDAGCPVEEKQTEDDNGNKDIQNESNGENAGDARENDSEASPSVKEDNGSAPPPRAPFRPAASGQNPPPPPPRPPYNPYLAGHGAPPGAAQGAFSNQRTPPPPPYVMGYPPYAVPQKKKKRVWPIVLGGVIGFFLLLFIIIGAIAGSSYKGGAPSLDTDYIAVIHIDSTIEGDYVTTQKYGSYGTHNQVFLIDTIYDLVQDDYNKGIMLYINSPGGEVTATDELGRAIEYYKETTSRPVYAYFADYATSGAYWIGSYADVITAHKFCITGSIGVSYGSHLDLSGLLEKLGIKVTNLTAGDNKAMGSEYEPLTEEQLKIYQEQLDEMHDAFIKLVCSNRGIEESKLRKIADGRTMLASKALEYGLVDAIGYYSDAQSKMIEDCGFDDSIVFYDCLDPDVVNFSISSYVKALDEKAEAEQVSDEQALAALLSDLSRNRRFLVLYER